MKTFLFPLALAFCAVALAGCATDSGRSSTGPGPHAGVRFGVTSPVYDASPRSRSNLGRQSVLPQPGKYTCMGDECTCGSGPDH
jgi:hypothetical protein